MRLLPGKRSCLPGQEAAPTSQMNRLQTPTLGDLTDSTLHNFGLRLAPLLNYTTRSYSYQ